MLLAVAALVTTLASCRSATEIVVDVRTNAAYRDGLVVSFTVGAPEGVESAAPTTEARAPWGNDGFVGSLTVVPGSGSSKNTSLGVKIVLGVDRDSRSCTPPDYRGCIVARRRIQYSPHERLELPIALYVQCKDVACDAASTCNLLGQCVSATVEPGTCSGPNGCNVAGDPRASSPPMPGDGGALDGSDGADATADGRAPGDAGLDAPVDGKPDAAMGGSPGTVDCGGGLTCGVTMGGACCFNANTATGTCTSAGVSCSETPGFSLVSCDGPEDCAPDQMCCAAGPTSQCASSCGPYAPICHSTKTCAAGACAPGTFGGGYYETCQ